MTFSRWRAGVLCLVLLAAAVYLRDPPWAGGMTSGLRGWEEDPAGTRFRWTTGRASFFIPSRAASMVMPLRAVFPGVDGRPVVVRVSVDDRWLADVQLANPEQWVRTTLPLPRGASSHRYRRVDVHVSRVIEAYLRGVELGPVEAR